MENDNNIINDSLVLKKEVEIIIALAQIKDWEKFHQLIPKVSENALSFLDKYNADFDAYIFWGLIGLKMIKAIKEYDNHANRSIKALELETQFFLKTTPFLGRNSDSTKGANLLVGSIFNLLITFMETTKKHDWHLLYADAVRQTGFEVSELLSEALKPLRIYSPDSPMMKVVPRFIHGLEEHGFNRKPIDLNNLDDKAFSISEQINGIINKWKIPPLFDIDFDFTLDMDGLI